MITAISSHKRLIPAIGMRQFPRVYDRGERQKDKAENRQYQTRDPGDDT
jgi:hypothetical protein